MLTLSGMLSKTLSLTSLISDISINILLPLLFLFISIIVSSKLDFGFTT